LVLYFKIVPAKPAVTMSRNPSWTKQEATYRSLSETGLANDQQYAGTVVRLTSIVAPFNPRLMMMIFS
jgi:hypothetical protein